MIKKLTKKVCDIAIIPMFQYVYDRLKLRSYPASNSISQSTIQHREEDYTIFPAEFLPEERQYFEKLFAIVKFKPLGTDYALIDAESLTVVPREGIFQALLAVKYILDNNIE